MDRIRTLAVAGVVGLAAWQANAVNYSFTNIVDDSSGAFTYIGYGSSVNASGTVAFSANGSDNTVGVYSGAGSSLHTVFQGSRSSYTVPFSPVINDAGAVAYLRSDIGVANHVIYDSGSDPTVVASSGGSYINVNAPTLNNNGTVVYGASTAGPPQRLQPLHVVGRCHHATLLFERGIHVHRPFDGGLDQ